MGSRIFPRIILGLLICLLLIPSVSAFYLDFGSFVETVVLTPKPQYQNTAQDYIKGGNFWKERCQAFSHQYNERLRAYVQQEAAAQNKQVDMSLLDKPTAYQRMNIIGSGFHARDPTAAQYYENMMVSCDYAETCYSKALQMTKDDNYAQQAEIFEAGAGIYDALGLTKQAQQVTDAALAARAHEAASKFSLPLPGWLAIAGILGGLYLLQRRRE